ncbi:hypothetical protein [Aestuariivivens sediminicola]|uniref:hypothetical protein n=1 Tax=Aestuariivivens sediminicola TaxID=2913560 RepID=UPI001F5AF0C1|nr:hypothetical protein [Aestuariivivens sediminicola]
MSRPFITTVVLLVCFVFTAFQCDEEEYPDYDTELAELNELKLQIETLAGTSECNDDTMCKFIAFGSKPCGGPWSYLVYSTSINTVELENLVASYNEKENFFNEKWGIASDCALAQQPTSITCENNSCVAVY